MQLHGIERVGICGEQFRLRREVGNAERHYEDGQEGFDHEDAGRWLLNGFSMHGTEIVFNPRNPAR